MPVPALHTVRNVPLYKHLVLQQDANHTTDCSVLALQSWHAASTAAAQVHRALSALQTMPERQRQTPINKVQFARIARTCDLMLTALKAVHGRASQPDTACRQRVWGSVMTFNVHSAGISAKHVLC
jgi:hypothetical protein